jgi:hypothetical protein
LAGLCSYRDVIESKVDLCDIATMNELLDVRDYNDRVMSERINPPAPDQPHPNPFDVFNH